MNINDIRNTNYNSSFNFFSDSNLGIFNTKIHEKVISNDGRHAFVTSEQLNLTNPSAYGETMLSERKYTVREMLSTGKIVMISEIMQYDRLESAYNAAKRFLGIKSIRAVRAK